MSKAKFYLSKHWWMGQFVIRGQPVVHYDLRLDEGKPSHRYWSLDRDPTYVLKDITAVGKTCDEPRWLTFTGTIPPKHKAPDWLAPGNPNKQIEAHVDRVDEGEVTILEDSPTFISFTFSGKKLKGYWIMRKPIAEENVWTFEKSELPKPQSELADTVSTSNPDLPRSIWAVGKRIRTKEKIKDGIEIIKSGEITSGDEEVPYLLVEFDDGGFQMCLAEEIQEEFFKPFKAFIPQKSSKINGISYFVDVKLLERVIRPSAEMPYIVEERLDGVRATLHKTKDRIEFYSKTGDKITDAVQHLTEEAKSLSNFDVVLDGIILRFDEAGKLMKKEETESLFKNPKDGKDSFLNYLAVDILYHNDKSLQDLKLYERKKVLNTLNFGSKIRMLPGVVVNDSEVLKKAIKFVSILDRSSGAFIKDANSLYHPNEKTDAWIEFGVKHA